MDKISKNRSAWRMRMIIGSIILVCSFIGLVIGDLSARGSWLYWRWMAPIFALLCIFNSWYLRRKDHSLSLTTVWHELLHWLGVLLSIYLVSFFAREGIIGAIDESLVVMTILALAVFLIGIYTEWSLIPVGIILWIFAAGAAFAQAYLFTIMLPILLIGLGLLLVIVHFIHRKQPTN